MYITPSPSLSSSLSPPLFLPSLSFPSFLPSFLFTFSLSLSFTLLYFLLSSPLLPFVFSFRFVFPSSTYVFRRSERSFHRSPCTSPMSSDKDQQRLGQTHLDISPTSRPRTTRNPTQHDPVSRDPSPTPGPQSGEETGPGGR